MSQRNANLELNRSDLLKLVSMLEGELQAREIAIAVLKSEQIKRLLNPSKNVLNKNVGFKTVQSLSSFVVNPPEISDQQTIKYSSDPLTSLSRDSFAVYDPSFDHSTTLALYNLKIYQLENLIRNEKGLRETMADHLKNLETKYESLVIELNEEKLKNANLESQFVDYDKNKLEDQIQNLKKQLEENSKREKQIIFTLLHERKHLIIKLIEERHQIEDINTILSCEKNKIAEMVEGLEDESKRSLQMEAELERQIEEFEVERNAYKTKLKMSETKNADLKNEVDKLKILLDNMHKQLTSAHKNSESVDPAKWNIGEGVRSSIVTMPVSNKVHSQVTPVLHPKASLAQPITKTVSVPKAYHESSSSSLSSSETFKMNTILPPPMIPVPQPKQSSCPVPVAVPSSNQPKNDGEIGTTNVINNKHEEPVTAVGANTDLPTASTSTAHKNDHSVKQNIHFFEKSLSQQKSGSSLQSTATMKKAGSNRVPPPVPPNKPTLKPVLPSQAIFLQNKLKNAKLSVSKSADSGTPSVSK